MSVETCVFHARIDLARATSQLLPLADLRDRDPDAYTAAFSKYDDTPERRRLRDRVIPVLRRRWTEVVFLSPVHPHAIWSAWREIQGRERPSMSFLAIPAADLPDGSVVLDRTITSTGDPIDPREVTPFSRSDHRAAFDTTARNRAWLEQCAKRGVRGAWFHGIPHVLAPGPVSLERAREIWWRDAP